LFAKSVGSGPTQGIYSSPPPTSATASAQVAVDITTISDASGIRSIHGSDHGLVSSATSGIGWETEPNADGRVEWILKVYIRVENESCGFRFGYSGDEIRLLDFASTIDSLEVGDYCFVVRGARVAQRHQNDAPGHWAFRGFFKMLFYPRASTYSWTAAQGGDFQGEDNWNQGQNGAPGPGSDCVFGIGGGGVLSNFGTMVRSLQINNGSYKLNTASDNLQLASTGLPSLDVSGGALSLQAGLLSSVDTVVGNILPGSIESGPGPAQWKNDGHLIVGQSALGSLQIIGSPMSPVEVTSQAATIGLNAEGRLNVSGGGRFTNQSLIFGRESGGNGQGMVADLGSCVQVRDWLVVGSNGIGGLTLMDSAQAQAAGVLVGYHTTSSGKITVRTGAMLRVYAQPLPDLLGIGNDGYGELVVEQAGQISCQLLEIGRGGKGMGTGEVVVRDPGSALLAQRLTVGTNGSLGLLLIQDGGFVNNGGELWVAQDRAVARPFKSLPRNYFSEYWRPWPPAVQMVQTPQSYVIVSNQPAKIRNLSPTTVGDSLNEGVGMVVIEHGATGEFGDMHLIAGSSLWLDQPGTEASIRQLDVSDLSGQTPSVLVSGGASLRSQMALVGYPLPIGPACSRGNVLVDGAGANRGSYWEVQTTLSIAGNSTVWVTRQGMIRVVTDKIEISGESPALRSGLIIGDGSLVEAPQVTVSDHGDLRVEGTLDVLQGGLTVSKRGALYFSGLIKGKVNCSSRSFKIVSRSSSPAPSPRMGRVQRASASSGPTIDGDLILDRDGVIEFELGGPNAASQLAGLQVTGQATLEGKVRLMFVDGYAPKRGDRFELLTVKGQTQGEFNGVELVNLAPGFQYDLEGEGGVHTLEALNDAVYLPTPPILFHQADPQGLQLW